MFNYEKHLLATVAILALLFMIHSISSKFFTSSKSTAVEKRDTQSAQVSIEFNGNLDDISQPSADTASPDLTDVQQAHFEPVQQRNTVPLQLPEDFEAKLIPESTIKQQQKAVDGSQVASRIQQALKAEMEMREEPATTATNQSEDAKSLKNSRMQGFSFREWKRKQSESVLDSLPESESPELQYSAFAGLKKVKTPRKSAITKQSIAKSKTDRTSEEDAAQAVATVDENKESQVRVALANKKTSRDLSNRVSGGSFPSLPLAQIGKSQISKQPKDFHGGNFQLKAANKDGALATKNPGTTTSHDPLDKLWENHKSKRIFVESPAVGNNKNDYKKTVPESNAEKKTSPLKSVAHKHAAKKQVAKKQDKAKQGFTPWWIEKLPKPIRKTTVSNITLDSVVTSAIQFAPQISSISREPIIAESFIREADSEFDPQLFVESKWSDTNEPVGNILVTGTAEFLKDNIWKHQTGIRKQMRNGSSLELFQDLGFQNSNSDFFDPQDQGTARLSLNFTQPLLNGSGRLVNRSQILIAQLNRDVALDRFSQVLQEHLLQVISGYWNVYYRRTVYLQTKRNYERADEILKILEGRKNFDTLANQLARTKAAVYSRKVDVRRAENAMLNAETNLRQLVRDPMLGDLGKRNVMELIPKQLPLVIKPTDDLAQLVQTALSSRPEIDQAFRNIRSSSVELQVAENDILPVLSLVVGGFLSGLEGGTGIERAWVEQFGRTPASYHAGIIFEYPLGNRAAKSRLQRTRAKLKKLTDDMSTVTGQVVSDVEIANRDLETQYDTFINTMESLKSAMRDADYIRKRWENFAFVDNADTNTPNTLLEQLLDAQQRLVDAETAFVAAVRNYMTAQANLSVATGTLLQQQRITPMRTVDRENPEILLERAPAKSGSAKPKAIPTPKANGVPKKTPSKK